MRICSTFSLVVRGEVDADIGSNEYTGTNGTKLSNYTIDVPVAPYLNTTYDYNIVAAIPYIAGVSLSFSTLTFLGTPTDNS
jgi:hypothetical protein